MTQAHLDRTFGSLLPALALAFAFGILAPGCGEKEKSAGGGQEGPSSAIARLAPTKGSKVAGTVRFVREGGGIRVTANVSGLSPGEHGFHIHEKGDCSAPDASSAGGHFNPTNEPHGGRNAAQRHVGDFGNITAGPDGRANVEFVDTKIALSGRNSIIGRAVIVHAGRDDLQSQPSGDAGARLACGVIEAER